MFFRSPVFFCPVLFFLFFISSFFRYLRSKIRSSLLKRFYSFFFLSFCISKKDLFSISSFSPFVAVLDQMIFSMFYHFTTTRRGGSLYPVPVASYFYFYRCRQLGHLYFSNFRFKFRTQLVFQSICVSAMFT